MIRPVRSSYDVTDSCLWPSTDWLLCLSPCSSSTGTVSRLRTGWLLGKLSLPVMTRVTPWTVWRPSSKNMKTLTRPLTCRSVRRLAAQWKLLRLIVVLFCKWFKTLVYLTGGEDCCSAVLCWPADWSWPLRQTWDLQPPQWSSRQVGNIWILKFWIFRILHHLFMSFYFTTQNRHDQDDTICLRLFKKQQMFVLHVRHVTWWYTYSRKWTTVSKAKQHNFI